MSFTYVLDSSLGVSDGEAPLPRGPRRSRHRTVAHPAAAHGRGGGPRSGYVYRTIDIAALGIAPTEVGTLTRPALLGFNALNITHPCKQLVVEHLDDLDAAARLGAVNTVIFDERGAVGYNTDASGFATAFRTGLPGAR